MNLPHVHLLLNHFPIIGTIIALGLFLISVIGKSDDLKRASLVVFAGIALLSIPAYMSGNGAEDAIRKLPGLNKAAVAAHNNAAVVSLVFVELTGIFAWLALWQFRRFSQARQWCVATVLLLSVVTIYFMTITGNTGGEIRHPEINPAQQTAVAVADSLVDAKALGTFVTGTKWIWPTCETLHFIGLSLLLGVVFLVDLRMLGIIKNVSFPALHRLLPWGILGFSMNVLTGLLFFIGEPGQYYKSAVFQWKMALVLIAGANALYFTMFDEVWVLAPGDEAPMQAKVAAGSAVLLWVAIMWCGNMLPFIGDSF
jgi:uncharacterized membrane protein